MKKNSKNEEHKEVKRLKKTRKKKKRLIKFICFIIAIISIFKIYSYISEENYKKKLSSYVDKVGKSDSLPNKSYKEIISKEDMDKDYDSDGLNNSKEIEIKTDPYNPDSDSDGISDEAELNIYSSDPKKYSTAGDEFSDGSKVNLNLDIDKKVSYFNKLKYKVQPLKFEEEGTDIKLETSDLNSYNDFIINHYKITYKNGTKILNNPFSVINYKGKVTFPVDFSEVSDKKNVKPYYFNSNTNEYFSIDDYSVTGNSIEADINGDSTLPIVVKEDIEKNKKLDINETNNFLYIRFNSEQYKDTFLGQILLWGLELQGITSEERDSVVRDDVIIYYKDNFLDSKNITTDDLSKDYVFNDKTNVYLKGFNPIKYEAFVELVVPILEKAQELLSEYTESFDNENFDDIQGLKLINFKEYNGTLNSLLTESCKIDKKIDKKNDTQAEVVCIDNLPYEENYFKKMYNVKTPFSVYKNAPSFPNFHTEEQAVGINKGGNCQGFATYTALMYNKIPIKRLATYKEYSYDLRNPKYDKLFNTNTITSFKLDGSEYVLEKHDINIDEYKNNYKDIEVLKMMGYYWKLSNDNVANNYSDKIFVGNRGIAMGLKNKMGIDGTSQSTSNAKKFLDSIESDLLNNKITLINVIRPDAGHAINAYAMRTDSKNPNIVVLDVYDNNFPLNRYDGQDNTNNLKLYVGVKPHKVLFSLGKKEVVYDEKFAYNPKESVTDMFKVEYGYNNNDDSYYLGVRIAEYNISSMKPEIYK
ncbi:hypothetical protein NNC19_20050 [Clostridium sp. SHJSY1]|uniref:hypothetical protein n=1 Tax=Clostridium sp. SHJSY1 TaxID=2942483 RepID=UPI0028755CE3|nr:hypothetical protein [Clostridium sp. SHJSY1]MDS0527990.1 hypothetical protein [Clostridium sp. SHJSY1]